MLKVVFHFMKVFLLFLALNIEWMLYPLEILFHLEYLRVFLPVVSAMLLLSHLQLLSHLFAGYLKNMKNMTLQGQEELQWKMYVGTYCFYSVSFSRLLEPEEH